MPELAEHLIGHLSGLSGSFGGSPEPLEVERDEDGPYEIPVFVAVDDNGEAYEVHTWQFEGTHTGPFLGIEPGADSPPAAVSFNGVTLLLPDGRWMTFIDSGQIMAQLGVVPGRSVAGHQVPA